MLNDGKYFLQTFGALDHFLFVGSKSDFMLLYEYVNDYHIRVNSFEVSPKYLPRAIKLNQV